MTEDQSQQHVERKATRKTCARCGRPIRPLIERVLRRLYKGELPEKALADQELCEECRRRAAVGRIRDSYLGKGDEAEKKPDAPGNTDGDR